MIFQIGVIVMGGKNHQPCNRPGTKYLKLSTLMSRALSVARSELEQANIELEDLLLAELDGVKSGSVKGIVRHLNESHIALKEAEDASCALRADMQEHEYLDLPDLHRTDLKQLGIVFSAVRIVDETAWSNVSEVMKEAGFFRVLRIFELDIHSLCTLTTRLRVAVSGTESAAANGTLNLVLEENRMGNFKCEFARLYTKWLEFEQFFLASSMLSTELWYYYQKVGSLAQEARSARAA